MRLTVVAWLHAFILALSLPPGGLWGGSAGAAEAPDAQSLPLATNVLQFHQLAAQYRRLTCSLRLEATVCAANPAKGLVVLQDSSGAELVQLDLGDQSLSAGQKVRLETERCLVALTGSGLRLRVGPVVDNDGVHGMTSKSGKVYLKAGRHPIRVAWFNQLGRYGLGVDYEGPGLARQRVPARRCTAARQKRPTVGPTRAKD